MNKYIIVEWPDVQELMDKPGFEQNSSLLTFGHLLEEYGSSTYFVNEDWIDNLDDEIQDFSFKRLKKYTIYQEEQFYVEAKSKEEAIKEVLEDPENYDNHTNDYEYLYETVSNLSVENNDGFSTVELYDDDDNLIWSNGKN